VVAGDGVASLFGTSSVHTVTLRNARHRTGAAVSGAGTQEG
jgi:hypothetical protein